MSACPTKSAFRGYENPDELEAAIAAAPEEAVCAIDPRQMEYWAVGPEGTSNDPSAPAPGYYHNGIQTFSKWEGGEVSVEVGNPSVTHDGTFREFVASRILAKTDAGNWVEVGVAENSWRTSVTPTVYAYTRPESLWIFPLGYPLTVGNFYAFRVRGLSNTDAYGDIFWDGAWRVLKLNPDMLCRWADGEHNCRIENYTEVYSVDGSLPDLNASAGLAGVDHMSGRLRSDPSTWVNWGPGVSTAVGDRAPYNLCGLTAYVSFRVRKNAC